MAHQALDYRRMTRIASVRIGVISSLYDCTVQAAFDEVARLRDTSSHVAVITETVGMGAVISGQPDAVLPVLAALLTHAEADQPASPQRPQADGALWGAIRPHLTQFARRFTEDDTTAYAFLDVIAQEIAEAAAAALPVRGRADEVVVRGRVCGADSLPIAGHSVEWLNGCVTVDVAFPAPWPKGVAIGGDATVILTQPAAADPGAVEPT